MSRIVEQAWTDFREKVLLGENNPDARKGFMAGAHFMFDCLTSMAPVLNDAGARKILAIHKEFGKYIEQLKAAEQNRKEGRE